MGVNGRKTRRWVLVGGSLLALLALAYWRPLQQKCSAFFLLRSEAPSEEILSDAVEHASNPGALLMGLWQTERLPHRQFVISYIGRISNSRSNLFRAMEPLLIEATRDVDVETRQLAFSALGRVKHPQLRWLALEQLSDADPAVRLIGLQSLRTIATSNDVPIAIRLLKDSEARVVVAAAVVLRQAIGQDFGIKSSRATPQFTCIETNPPPAPDLPGIRHGVERWQGWWTSHQVEFPSLVATPVAKGRAARLATGDFTLEDSAGKPIQLSQFRGKMVLLSFWSSGAPASLDDVPALKALEQRLPDRLAVLGVSIPSAPSCSDEHANGHDHAHHHHDASAVGAPGTEHMRCLVKDAATRLKIEYPMLVDTKGSIGLRFSIEDLPAYVLIDAEGMVRRRLVGFRTEQALAAMVEEAASSGPATARLSLSANEH
jgi:peroxiredoxin